MTSMNDELYHHGVLGMKWGIRRYQPYPKGKKPKGAKELGEAKKAGKEASSTKESKKAKAKTATTTKAKKMSDEELRTAISRLELEKKYAQLLKDTTPSPTKSDRGKAYAKKFFGEIVEDASKNIGKQLATYALGTAVNKIAKADIVNPKKGQSDKKK